MHVLVRPQIGGVWIGQEAERPDSDRLTEIGLPTQTSTRSVFGPLAAAGLALEYFPWSRTGIRIEGRGALAWLSVDGRLDVRTIGSGVASWVFRL